MDELIARLLEEARKMSIVKYWVEVCTIDPDTRENLNTIFESCPTQNEDEALMLFLCFKNSARSLFDGKCVGIYLNIICTDNQIEIINPNGYIREAYFENGINMDE